MKECLLLLPIIFIVHDMEEIVGFGWFFRKNPWLFDRYPKVMNTYRDLYDMAWTIGVYEEFIPFFGISLLAYYFPGNILFALWYGFFLDLAAHFVVHIAFAIKIKKYIPSVITSVIFLPISVLILYKCALILTFDLITVIFIAAGILLMIANFEFLRGFMPFISKKMKLEGLNKFHVDGE